MARKERKGFGSVLSFIGLVDDGDPRDNYVEDYSSNNYGRQQPYTPQRSRVQERPRQDISRRYSSSGYEPTRAPRMNRTSSAGTARSAGNTARKSSAYVEQTGNRSRYDYSPRTSRFGNAEENGYPAENAAPRPQRNDAAYRQRTLMFTLHELVDCCNVIDNLILDNTVVLTLDAMEPGMVQRAVDTLSGAAFALHGTIRKVSEYTYLIAPNSVMVDETTDSDKGIR